MGDTNQERQAKKQGSELSAMFSRQHVLIKTDAAATALVCGAATAIVLASIGGYVSTWWYAGAIAGALTACVIYLVRSPDSMVTRCLLAARKEFLDDRTTVLECERMRRQCLRKSLWY